MEFTPQQQQAIKTRGVNILVSAGAGSGKTGVLTERIVDRLRDGEDIDKLLVLTYTKAAAAEMLTRIRKKIFAELRRAKTKEAQNHWHRQIILLGDAPITTMHSFCMQLVRRHYNAFPGLDPAFKIMEPSIAKVHLQDLLTTYFETCYTLADMEERQRFFSLVRLYGSRLSDDGLKEVMIQLREFGYAQGNLEEWLDAMLKNFCDLDFWHEEALETAKKEASVVLESLEDILGVCRRKGGPASYEGNLAAEAETLSHLLADWTWEHVQKTMVFGSIGRKGKGDDPGLAGYLKGQHELCKKYYGDHVEAMIDRDYADYAREISLAAENMETLVKSTKTFSQIYQDYKTEKGFMEFSDLEQYAYDLLRHHPALAKEYQAGFHEVLIDEYQDVNPLQEKIISLLSNGTNLFVVGDVKQSIYGFRFADHHIFKARFDSYATGQANENGINILLNKNFRSQEGILDAVNYFYRQWMNPSYTGIGYEEADELNIGDQKTQTNGTGKINTELQFIYIPEEEERSSDYDSPAAVHLHGRYLAKRIAEMLEQGETIWENGIERPMTYGDIAILLRSAKGDAPIIEEELTYFGIPVTGPNRRSFTNEQEVRLLLSILSVVDNPCQDIPLAAVMRSPFFDFDENDLLEITFAAKRKCLWNRMAVFLAEKRGSDLGEKVVAFQKQVAVWRQYSHMYPLCDLLQKIMEDIHYAAFWAALPNHKNPLRNIEILLDKAKQFEENGGGLFDFLRYIKNLQASGADTVDDALEENDCVRISTIHKSKGLEYPVVFCCVNEKKFNAREYSEDLLLDSTLGYGPNNKNFKRHTKIPTLPRLLIKEKKKRMDMAEQLRVLYVAMTRAKNKLIFTTVIKKKEDLQTLKTRASWVAQEKLPVVLMASGYSYMHWLCFALSRKENLEVVLPHQQAALKETLLPAANPLEQRKRNGTVVEVEEASLERLKKNLCYQEPAVIPGKVTVTELLPKIDYFESHIIARDPQFLAAEAKVSPVETGTVFHRFMEHLDYRKTWDIAALKEYQEAMIEGGYFPPQTAEVIDLEAVLSFLASTYGEDLKTAKEIRNEMAFTATFPVKELLGIDSTETTVLQGAIDMLYQRANGEWVLLDYKTNRLMPEQETIFLEHYGKQLDLYAKVLKHLYQIDVTEKIFYLTREKRFLSHI